jgi:hypothetical protein
VIGGGVDAKAGLDLVHQDLDPAAQLVNSLGTDRGYGGCEGSNYPAHSGRAIWLSF